ncbi:MAG TPA: DUF6676 family protein [Pseudonocardia sp.]|nr:DUF6676 family protein [Pseudonocardia sp.]
MPGRPPSLAALAAQPPGTDLDGLVADLADNGVAAPGDEAPLAAVVDAAAAEHDLALSVVVVPEAGGVDELVALAEALRAERGGTVLVLSPRFGAAASDTHADVGEAARDLPLGDAQAAQAFVDELTDPGPPWLAILLAGAALLALVIGGGRWWELRRRRRRDAAALAAEGARLRHEVRELADEMLALEPRVGLRQRPDLDDEYSAVAVEYRDLTHAVEADPGDRRAADALAARVRALHERVRALDAATQH